jgi:two-component system, NtrC family, sensor histidine kinase GlrK
MKVGIYPRWAFGYLSLFLLLAGSNTYALLKLHELGATVIPSMNTDIQLLDYQRRLVDSTLSQLRYERKFSVVKDDSLYQQFLDANKEFHSNLQEGRRTADSPARKMSFDTIEKYQTRYERLVFDEADHIKRNLAYSQEWYLQRKYKWSDLLLDQLKSLENQIKQDVTLRMSTARRTTLSALRMVLGAALISVLFALVISFYVTRSITSPLKRLVGRTREISAGVFRSDLDIKAPQELSELSRAFNSMCEKLTAVDKMKGDILSMISHELRTPLTTIKEGTSLLLEGVGGSITGKQERLLSILSTETNRLIVMVNSILDLSKMEAGMMVYTFNQAKIGDLVDQAIHEITPLAEAKKITFQKNIDQPISPQRMDKERMLQVLRNLLGNAVKFTPEGGKITVSATTVEGSTRLSVEDTGPGIADDKLATIFEKFSGSDHHQGTGLGLAIVRHIIDVHGGKVWAESTQGRGSKFTFILPS